MGLLERGHIGSLERTVNDSDVGHLRLRVCIASDDGAIEVFSDRGRVQTIKLVRRLSRCGRASWSFLEGGRLSRKLYFSAGSYGSRLTKGLVYASQFESSQNRHLRWIMTGPRIHAESPKTSYKAKTTRRSARTADGLETLERALWSKATSAAMAPSVNERSRRASFEERVLAYRKVLARGGRPSASVTLARAMELQEQAKGAAGSWAGAPTGHFQNDKRSATPRKSFVDLPILRRLGALPAGEAHLFPLSWPDDWLAGAVEFVDVLMDLRPNVRPCCLLLIHDVGTTTVQLFDLVEIVGDFGKPDLRFQDPRTGRISKRLVYRSGKFAVPTFNAKAYQHAPKKGYNAASTL
jgi:hypothetical protein